jgi:hypothetical protein
LALLLSCEKENSPSNIDIEQLEDNFFEFNHLKTDGQSDKVDFTVRSIDSLKNYNAEVNFIPWFTDKLGYADWSNARYFEVNDETVLQIPVYRETDEQVQALIIAAIKNDFLDCYVIERNKFDAYIGACAPQLTLEKVIDLFMIADFNVFDRSDYWPNGRVYYGPPTQTLLKGAEVWEVCYHTEGWVGNHKVSHTVTCELEIRYVDEQKTFLVHGNGGGFGGGGTSYNGFKPNHEHPDDNDNRPDIKNGLTQFPCASRVLLNFINFDALISNMIQSVFGENSPVNITFKANLALAGSNTSGTSRPLSSSEFVISLNPDILTNATQEYIAVTYAHEALHALIDYYWLNDPIRGKELFPLFMDFRSSKTDFLSPPTVGMSSYESEKQHHETMAEKYINEMVNVILTVNPNFPINDAKQLAWGGLQNTWAYELKKMSGGFDSKGNSIWEQNHIRINQAEKTGSSDAKGNKCTN